MADEGSGSNNTGVVALVVIFVIAMVLGYFAWQNGMFGGSGSEGGDTSINVDLAAPGGGPAGPSKEPAPPEPSSPAPDAGEAAPGAAPAPATEPAPPPPGQ